MGPLYLSGTETKPVVSLRRVGAWTKWVNMLFIDQPAGVSFSYSTNTKDYALNSDTRSAKDNFYFIKQFFAINPQYAKNDWWITGESYGGVYCRKCTFYKVSLKKKKNTHRVIKKLTNSNSL
jgi:carboxypeptidase C (cathepsin A)